nr:DUF2975 domain-containing protein [Sphingomicrobium sediminis]
MEKRTKWMALAALFVFAVMTVLTALQFHGANQMGANQPAFYAILLPMPFYLYAMGSVWWMLRRISLGNGFAPSVSAGLRRVGMALFAGGLVEVFGQNLFTILVAGRSLFEVDATAIAIGVVGVGLYSIAGLIDEAREAKTELDSFI